MRQGTHPIRRTRFAVARRWAASALLAFVALVPGERALGAIDSPTLRFETLHSAALEREMPLTVYLPPDYRPSRRYPVLYLYHGMREDEKYWDKIDLYDEADRLIRAGRMMPIIIVTPHLDNSFGVNNRASFSHANPAESGGSTYTRGRYEDYLRDEVVHFVDQRFSTVRNRSGRYVGGISMGGFAALHMAFRHPDLFSRVGAHSPALFDGDWDWLYPADVPRKTRDPLLLARERDLGKLEVYIDCGLQDRFNFQIPARQLADTLKERGVAVQAVLRPGAHRNAYWREHVPEYLLFYAGRSTVAAADESTVGRR